MNTNPKKDRVDSIRSFLLRRARRNNFDSLHFRLRLEKLVQELRYGDLPIYP